PDGGVQEEPPRGAHLHRFPGRLGSGNRGSLLPDLAPEDRRVIQVLLVRLVAAGLVRLAGGAGPAFVVAHLLVSSFIGTCTPRSVATCCALSYPASTCRKIPIAGSLVSSASSLAAANSVPSATPT